MDLLKPIIFAAIAALGNAMFALGQKKSSGVDNGILFVGLSALVAVFISLSVSPLIDNFELATTIKVNWKAIFLSGIGLFLTYLGFNLLYSRYGVSQYVIYAVISIITTTLVVGVWWLREPVNIFHIIAIALAISAVVIFSFGQSQLRQSKNLSNSSGETVKTTALHPAAKN